MSFRSMMKHECTIHRSGNEDVNGAMRTSFSSPTTDEPFNLQTRRGRVRNENVGEYVETDAECTFLPTLDVQAGDIVEVTSGPSHVGDFYKVEKVGDESGRGHHLRGHLSISGNPST